MVGGSWWVWGSYAGQFFRGVTRLIHEELTEVMQLWKGTAIFSDTFHSEYDDGDGDDDDYY